MSKRVWIHEGVFYGRRGNYVGSYYSNDAGWWVHLLGGSPEQVKSRRAAIQEIEEADANPTERTPDGERRGKP